MKDFTLYPEALELKQLGFDEPCFAYYKDGRITGVNKWDREDWGFHVITSKEITSVTSEIVIAPTYSQAFRFFREKYNLKSIIWSGKISTVFYGYDILNIEEQKFIVNNSENGGGECDYESYEHSEYECLKKLIELVKNGR